MFYAQAHVWPGRAVGVLPDQPSHVFFQRECRENDAMRILVR